MIIPVGYLSVKGSFDFQHPITMYCITRKSIKYDRSDIVNLDTDEK